MRNSKQMKKSDKKQLDNAKLLFDDSFNKYMKSLDRISEVVDLTSDEYVRLSDGLNGLTKVCISIADNHSMYKEDNEDGV